MTANLTEQDIDACPLFELPSNTRLIGFIVGVTDAFNTSAKLALGVQGTGNDLVAAQAIDAVGAFPCTLLKEYKTAGASITITGTVSDKTVTTGACSVTILFAMDIDVKF